MFCISLNSVCSVDLSQDNVLILICQRPEIFTKHLTQNSKEKIRRAILSRFRFMERRQPTPAIYQYLIFQIQLLIYVYLIAQFAEGK